MRKSGLVAFFVMAAVAFGGAFRADAGPALVFDSANGTVLYSEEADKLWYPASLTKLMTAYVTFHAIRQGQITLQTEIVCSKNAHSQPPSKIGLPIGGTMSLEKALQALIVKSGNDIAVMIAEAVGGSEDAFIRRMNQTAHRLGMHRTVFYNPHGLPHPDQVTTARDLARLTRAIIVEFPEYDELFSMRYVAIGDAQLRAHNGMLRTFDGADGMKTGFICDSGYNIISSATRNGRRVVAVVLGAKSGSSRRARATELMEHGFRRFSWKQVFAPTIEGLPVQSSLAAGPTSIRETICGPRRATTAKASTSGRKEITVQTKNTREAGAIAGVLPVKKKRGDVKTYRMYSVN